MDHISLNEFAELMGTPCVELSANQFLQMLECSVSSDVVLIDNLLRLFPEQAKKRMKLDGRDLASMEKFLTRVHRACKGD